MSLQIQQLKNSEEDRTVREDCIIAPRGWGVIWSQVEVHRTETKQNEVMEAILEYVGKGHSIVGKFMHKKSLELALQVMTQAHAHTKLLVVCQFRIRSIYLLSEKQKQQNYDNRPTILNQENCCPRNLWTQIFEKESHLWVLEIFR